MNAEVTLREYQLALSDPLSIAVFALHQAFQGGRELTSSTEIRLQVWPE